MYSILVADDEAIIREGIKVLFDYEALGFTICSEAATGDETLEKIHFLQPDVVLMDIRMPGMTGLEVIKAAREQGYEGKVIIISSYSDFKYAQEAIRHGVQYYITKPIDEDELENILHEFKETFDREALAKDASAHYRKKARASILKDILLGEADLSHVNLSDMRLSAEVYQVVAYEKYSDLTYPEPEDFSSLLRLSNQNDKSYDQITLQNNAILLLKGTNALQKFEDLLHRFQHEHSPQPRALLDSFFVAYGRPVHSLEEVPVSYQEALQMKSRRFFCEQDQHTLGYPALPDLESTQPVLSKELLDTYSRKLLNYIQTFNRNMMAQTLKELQVQLCHASDSIDAIKLFITDLHLQIKEQMNRLYPENTIPFYTNAQLIRAIDQTRYLYELIRFLAQRFEVMMSAIGTSSRDSVLEDILHYIAHNYAENITLENIAPLFGYNHSYLGKIFTKKMGQSFNSYVDHVRIERAKELLIRDNAKVYAIAERVGYKNVDYFHIKFKKYVGQSPAEFRKKNKGTSCLPVQASTEKGPLF